MKHCPNPDCRHARAHGLAAEFRDEKTHCSDCAAALADGEAPAPLARLAADGGPAAERSPSPPPWRRLAVTLAAAGAVAAAQRVRLPGVDPDALQDLARGTAPTDLSAVSVVALGLGPLVGAFAVVELAAVLVARWRPLRSGGSEARARLTRAACITALVIATMQGLGVANWLDASGLVRDADTSGRMLRVAVLVGGVFACLGAARLVDRSGLGSGFSALIVGAEVPSALRALGESWTMYRPEQVTGLGLGLSAAGVAAIAFVTVRALRASGSGPAGGLLAAPSRARAPYRAPGRSALYAHTQTGLRLPASGLEPYALAASLLLLPTTLANLRLPFAAAVAGLMTANAPAYAAAFAALVAALAVVFAWLFNRPERVAEVRARRLPPGASPAEHASVLAEARRQLRAATRGSVLYLAAVVAVETALGLVAGVRVALGSLAVAVGTAVALDLVGEWRARRRHGDLVAVWPVHRLYAVDPALAALAEADIVAHPRGVHHRTLLQFFGAYVPVDMLVPRAQAREAERILHELLPEALPDAPGETDPSA